MTTLELVIQLSNDLLRWARGYVGIVSEIIAIKQWRTEFVEEFVEGRQHVALAT